MRRALIELLDRQPVVQRVHGMRPGRPVERLDELAQQLRVLGRKIDRLGKIGGLPVQGPCVEVDRPAAFLQRHGDPAASVIRAIGPALVVLLLADRRRLRVEQERLQTGALHRQRAFAMRAGERSDARQIEQGWHHVEIGRAHV